MRFVIVSLFVMGFCGSCAKRTPPPVPVVTETACMQTTALMLILPDPENEGQFLQAVMPGGCRCAIDFEGREYISSGPVNKEKCNGANAQPALRRTDSILQ